MQFVAEQIIAPRPITVGNVSVRAARLLSRVIFYGLLSLLALAAIPYGTAEVWWTSLFESAVFTLTALCIVESTLSGEYFVREHRMLLPLCALILFIFAQSLPLSRGATGALGIPLWNAISADPYESRLVALKFIAFALVGALLLRYTSTRRRLRALIHVVIGIGVASALFGIARLIMQRGANAFVLPYLLTGTGYGQFINRNHFAFLMEMALGLILGLVIGRGVRREQRLVYLAAALAVWAALVLSNSRGAIFSMLGQMLFLCLLFYAARQERKDRRQTNAPRRWRLSGTHIMRVALLAALMLALIMGIIWMGGDQLATKLESAPVEISAQGPDNRWGDRRREVWQTTWQVIKENPLAGVGFGGYWIAISQYHNASGKVTPQQAHNDYLELLASGGLLGVLLWVWLAAAVIGRARACLRDSDSFRRAAYLGALVGVFGVAAHSLVDFGLHITINALVCITLLVIATVQVKSEDEVKSVAAFGDSPRAARS
ncbi:MAG TPA: O-antigen ligase family protein [Pyrinomonadaceae bacterium]|jgi:O-antigen ligase